MRRAAPRLLGNGPGPAEGLRPPPVPPVTAGPARRQTRRQPFAQHFISEPVAARAQRCCRYTKHSLPSPSGVTDKLNSDYKYHKSQRAR